MSRMLSVVLSLAAVACGNEQRNATPTPAPMTSASAEHAMAHAFENYVAPVDLELVGQVLSSSWWWLEGIRDLRPVALTLAGDVFLIDRSNAIYFLDTNFGIVERVAASNDDFRDRLKNEAFARSILRINLVDALRSHGVTVERNQCYMLALSPLIGGSVTPDRVRPGDFQVLLAFLGQLNEQTKALAVGEELRLGFSGFPGEASPPARGTLRKHARDRPSFGLP